MQCIKYLIGDGADTLLWLDPWHPRGVLQLALGERMSFEVNHNRMAKVATIRDGNRWHTTRRHLACLIPDWDTVDFIDTLQDSKDAIAWTPSQTGSYTLKSAYEFIRPTGTNQAWHHQVWFKGAIPRYSFITWLLYKEKLTTLDRLQQWGMIQDNKCHICKQQPETLQHLFFECSYTSRIWAVILQKCSITRTPAGWTSEKLWLLTALAGGQPNYTARKIALTTTVYHIWTERNNRIFKGCNRPIQSIIYAITAAIKCRLTFLFPQAQDTAENRATLGSWGVQIEFSTKPHIWTKWIPPKPGHIALNTDASLCQARAGLGYILRNDKGDPILMGTNTVTPSSYILLHEMQAILRGLTTATNRHFHHIQVQSDSKVAVDIMNGTATAPWFCWTTLSSIKSISSKHNITFSFVHRQANQPADYLSHACQHISRDDILMLPGEAPNEIQALIDRDKQ